MEQLAKKTVSYFYDEEYANHSLGGSNPMRPHRVRLTNRLLEGYNLTQRMRVHRPRALDYEHLNYFHADEYLTFLSKVTPSNQREYKDQVTRFNLGVAGEADCPVFDGMFEYCQLYAGGSRDGALQLMEGQSDIAFNWAGGMHHAKRAEASGFCYVNDIVLAILELLKQYQRVLYVDIDIHHGDGVEEAFYLTDRVMTVSFHKYGDNFFPGTGAQGDVGHSSGKGYSINVPLREGMDDESYKFMYEPVMKKVMAMFQPEAIVVCAGADSLSGDRLGCFNLSLEGHSNCLEFLAMQSVPLLVLGGGGYTMRNVSRCWTFETARLQGIDLPDEIPEATISHHAFYKDTGRLRIDVSNMMNMNSNDSLIKLRDTVLEILSQMKAPTGVPISAQPAPGKLEEAPEEDPDVRGGGVALDERRVVKNDGYDSDEETTERVSEKEAPARAPAAPAALPRVAEDGGGQAGGLALMEGVVKAEPSAEPATPAPVPAVWSARAPVPATGGMAVAAEAAPAPAVAGGAAVLQQPAAAAVEGNADEGQEVATGSIPAVVAPMVGVVAPMPLQDQAKPFAGPAAVHSVPVGQVPVAEAADVRRDAQAAAGTSAAPEAKPWPPA